MPPITDEPYGEPMSFPLVLCLLAVPYLVIAGTILTCWGLGQLFAAL